MKAPIIQGWILLLLGFVLIVLNAISYLFSLSLVPKSTFLFGIVFVAISLIFMKKRR